MLEQDLFYRIGTNENDILNGTINKIKIIL